MDGIDRSVETQEEIARKLWRTEIHGELFKRARNALGLDVRGAADGPLKGILTERRMRRCEKGQALIPPQAWRIFAEMLTSGQRLVGADLIEQVKDVCRSQPEEPNDPLTASDS